jgi:hypothetical protein
MGNKKQRWSILWIERGFFHVVGCLLLFVVGFGFAIFAFVYGGMMGSKLFMNEIMIVRDMGNVFLSNCVGCVTCCQRCLIQSATGAILKVLQYQ